MKRFLLPLLFAATFAQAADNSSSTLKETLIRNYGQILGEVRQVNPSPIRGMYEVVTQDRIFYADESGQFVINGSLYDLKAQRNLTEERARKLFAIDFNSLPLDLALKKVKGNGSRKLAYFTDPNCGYCKKLEQELKQINDVTLYLFLYPIFNGSEEKVQGVWCSKDRVKAWDDLMLNGVRPAAGQCATPIAKVRELGSRLRISGTPALIFADGSIVPGYLPAADLDMALNNAKAR